MTGTLCCYIDDMGQDALRKPCLTIGDIRAVLMGHACRARATMEVVGPSRPDDFTHSCDRHIGYMSGDGSTVHAL